MYRCEKCGCQVPANVPAMRVVTETRSKVYTEPYLDKHGNECLRVIGKGRETAEELKVCHTCMGLTPPPVVEPEVKPLPEPQASPKFSLVLANGCEVGSNKGEELHWFHKTNGASITQPKKKKRGGKSKGARNKGKSKVKRTRDER